MRVLYFAWVRERVGTGEEIVSPPGDVVTMRDLVDWLAGRSDAHQAAFGERDRLRAAVDQRFVAMEASVIGAQEVAIFPPVTGG